MNPRTLFCKALGLLVVTGCSGGGLQSTATGTGGVPGGGPGAVPGGGGTGGIDGGPATCVRVTPSAPASTGDLAHDTANAQAFGLVDRLLGRYLRGDAPVYAGAASVEAPPEYPDGPTKIAATSAFASLATDSDPAILTVFSPAEKERVLFEQFHATPSVTDTSTIVPDNSFPGGPSGAVCAGCVPDLFAHPSSLAWTDIVAIYNGTTGSPFQIRSSASLASISPCSLTFDQLNAVSADWPDRLQDFTAAGGRLVLRKQGFVVTKNASRGTCDGFSVSYTIDAYVDPANLVDYGVTNYTPTDGTFCGPS